MPGPGGMVPKKNSPLAIVSLVTGILGLLCCPFIPSLVAIITGVLAKKEIKQKPEQLTGDGMATGGIVLGVVGLIVMVIGVILQLTMGLINSL
jgi:predicted acyltransferase